MSGFVFCPYHSFVFAKDVFVHSNSDELFWLRILTPILPCFISQLKWSIM